MHDANTRMITNETDKNIYHANIVIGREKTQDFILEILEKNLNFYAKANPDFLLIEKESFGIDDARDLERWATGKPLIGEIKVSLVAAKSITFEAQNALLKVLEEPTLGTYIFIKLENLGGILPTFISRVRVLNIPKDNKRENIFDKNNTKDKSYNFFNSKIKERLSIIHSLSKKEDKDNMKEIIKNLEIISYQNYTSVITRDNSKTQAMKNILTAKIFAATRGSSPKMLLEWLSCVL
jgi:DNA polymerase III delta prime subunit